MTPSAAQQAVTRDPDAAREFQEAYGVNANAEDIIAANAARSTKELKIAQRIAHVDESATDKMTFTQAGKAAGVDGDDVRGYAVRGNFVVVVYEDDRGDYRKVAVPKGDFELTPDEEAVRSEVNSRASVMRAAREAREDQEKLLAEAAHQGQVEASAKVQEAVQAAGEEQAKAAAKAEKAREKDNS